MKVSCFQYQPKQTYKGYVEISLIKEIKDLYSENFKFLYNEIEAATRRWKGTLSLWIGRINNVKMASLPKVIYRFNAIPAKISRMLFMKIKNSNIHMVPPNTLDSKSNTE